MSDLIAHYEAQPGDLIIKFGKVNPEHMGSLRVMMQTMYPPGAYYVVPDRKQRAGNSSIVERPWSNNAKLQEAQLHKLSGKKVGTFNEGDYFNIRSRAARLIFDVLLDGEPHTESELIALTGQKQALRRQRELRPLLALFGLDIVCVKPRDFDGLRFAYKIASIGEAFDRIASKIMSNDTAL